MHTGAPDRSKVLSEPHSGLHKLAYIRKVMNTYSKHCEKLVGTSVHALEKCISGKFKPYPQQARWVCMPCRGA
jgi:hypothetical protein